MKKKKEVEYSDEFFCTNCGAVLNEQFGFDPDAGHWSCTECGTMLMGDDVYGGERFENVSWFCDNCGAFLNEQAGFSDLNSSWCCTECGYENEIDESEIYASEKEYRRSQRGHSFLDSLNSINGVLASVNSALEGFVPDDEEEDGEYETEYDDNDDYEDVEYDLESFNERRDRQNRRSEDPFYNVPQQKPIPWKFLLIGGLALLLTIAIGIGYHEFKLRIPAGYSSNELIGQNYKQVVYNLETAGFTNVSSNEIADLSVSQIEKDNQVTNVKIGGNSSFDKAKKFPSNYKVVVTYHTVERYELAFSSKDVKGCSYSAVEKQFKNAGFANVKLEPKYDIVTGWVTDDGQVEAASINGNKSFSTGDSYRADSEIVITYHTWKKNKPE